MGAIKGEPFIWPHGICMCPCEYRTVPRLLLLVSKGLCPYLFTLVIHVYHIRLDTSIRKHFIAFPLKTRAMLGSTSRLERTQNNCVWRTCSPGASRCSIGETLRTQGSPHAHWPIRASDSCGARDAAPLLLRDTKYLSVKPLLFAFSFFLVALSSDASLRQTRGTRPARQKFVRLSYTIHHDEDDDDCY